VKIQLDETKIEEDNLKRDTLLFDLIKRRYDAEWDRIAGLDSKANNFIGFVSVVTGLLLGSSTFTFSKLLSYPSLTVLYFFGTGLLLVSIGFALSAIKIRRWHAVPETTTTKLKIDELKMLVYKYPQYHNNDPDEILRWAVYGVINGDNKFLDDKLEQLRTIDSLAKY
jgi:hypothetical protein